MSPGFDGVPRAPSTSAPAVVIPNQGNGSGGQNIKLKSGIFLGLPVANGEGVPTPVKIPVVQTLTPTTARSVVAQASANTASS